MTQRVWKIINSVTKTTICPFPSEVWPRQFKVHDMKYPSPCLKIMLALVFFHTSEEQELPLCWENQDKPCRPLCLLSWLPGSMAAHCLGFFLTLGVGHSPLIYSRNGFCINWRVPWKKSKNLLEDVAFPREVGEVSLFTRACQLMSAGVEGLRHIEAMSSAPHIYRLLYWIKAPCREEGHPLHLI